jgi:hypothetical protein
LVGNKKKFSYFKLGGDIAKLGILGMQYIFGQNLFNNESDSVLTKTNVRETLENTEGAIRN